MKIPLKVNGKSRSVDVDADTPLLWVLRDELSLTGTKYGCGRAQCGACTVFVAGEPTRSCVLAIDLVGDREVVTIEGVEDAISTSVRDAWVEHQVPQCGFCQSGQIMSAVALLRKKRNPSEDEIDAAMAGNICRCATYDRIRNAIRTAAGRGGR